MARLGRGHPASAYLHIVTGGTVTVFYVSDSDIANWLENDTPAPTIRVSSPTLANDTYQGLSTELVTVAKSDGDTGFGAETSSIAATLSDSQTGTGVDASTIVATIPTQADTGTSSESQSVVNAVSSPDTGVGVDANNNVNVTCTPDTGTGVDTHTNRQFAQSDTGTGVETGAPGSATPTAGDTGVFSEGGNIDKGAPDARTLRIPREDRTKYVPDEDLTLYVALESRVKVVT